MERVSKKSLCRPLCDLVTEDIVKIGYNKATRNKYAVEGVKNKEEQNVCS